VFKNIRALLTVVAFAQRARPVAVDALDLTQMDLLSERVRNLGPKVHLPRANVVGRVAGSPRPNAVQAQDWFLASCTYDKQKLLAGDGLFMREWGGATLMVYWLYPLLNAQRIRVQISHVNLVFISGK